MPPPPRPGCDCGASRVVATDDDGESSAGDGRRTIDDESTERDRECARDAIPIRSCGTTRSRTIDSERSMVDRELDEMTDG